MTQSIIVFACGMKYFIGAIITSEQNNNRLKGLSNIVQILKKIHLNLAVPSYLVVFVLTIKSRDRFRFFKFPFCYKDMYDRSVQCSKTGANF